MSAHQQSLAFQHVPTYRQLLLNQLYESPCVLSFDPVTMELVTWCWCVPFIRVQVKPILIICIGLLMDTNWCRRRVCATIVTITNSLDRHACVLYFDHLRKTLYSRKEPYIYLYLAPMQANTLLNAKKVDADTWASYCFHWHSIFL